MDHLRQANLGEKKKQRSGLGVGIYNTCAKFQGLSLYNGLDIWTFVPKNESRYSIYSK